MATRKEEKEQRKRERQAREQEFLRAAQRRRRHVRAVGSGVLVGATIVAVVIVATVGGGRGGSSAPNPGPALLASARAAGCELHSYPNFGQKHTTAKVTYKTNPPTSGPHNPAPADDGIYDRGGAPPVDKTVHALEHGRVQIQWKPGLGATAIAKLQRALFSQNAGRPDLLFENQTGMPYRVAATAWRQVIGCTRFSPAALQALRDFRARYTDQGPERVP